MENTTMTKRPLEMPTLGTIVQWVLDDHDGFAARFHQARRLGSAKNASEIFEIAEGALAALMTPGAPNPDDIARSLLAIQELCGPIMELIPGIDDDPPAESTSKGVEEQMASRHRRTRLN